ncbi:hypothetical protein VTK73DRAFT_486 [Phialemonium thermophilum]|uniref:Uncharacterized protein n=1 Tax=Phialemonium thermophilum TaxID=223376 RepID=A0ABR3VUZ4_9PEZI
MLTGNWAVDECPRRIRVCHSQALSASPRGTHLPANVLRKGGPWSLLSATTTREVTAHTSAPGSLSPAWLMHEVSRRVDRGSERMDQACPGPGAQHWGNCGGGCAAGAPSCVFDGLQSSGHGQRGKEKERLLNERTLFFFGPPGAPAATHRPLCLSLSLSLYMDAKRPLAIQRVQALSLGASLPGRGSFFQASHSTKTRLFPEPPGSIC